MSRFALPDDFGQLLGHFYVVIIGDDIFKVFFQKDFIIDILSVMSSLSRPVSLNDISCGL